MEIYVVLYVYFSLQLANAPESIASVLAFSICFRTYSQNRDMQQVQLEHSRCAAVVGRPICVCEVSFLPRMSLKNSDSIDGQVRFWWQRYLEYMIVYECTNGGYEAGNRWQKSWAERKSSWKNGRY